MPESRIALFESEGVELLVEVSRNSAYPEKTSMGRDRVRVPLAEAIDRVHSAIAIVGSSVAAAVRRMEAAETPPAEFEARFGIKFGEDGAVVLASAPMNANIEIQLTYVTRRAEQEQ